MNIKNKLIIIFLPVIIIILITVFTVISINNEEKTDFEATDLSERILINDFLQRNPYISIMDNFEKGLVSDTDIVKAAIYSEDIELEYIVTEEIKQNEILATFEGYKKSIDNINKYAKNVFNRGNLELNFVDTYYNEDGYLLLNEEFVYFSEQKYPEKIYVAVRQKKQEDVLQVQIYEYTINENIEKLENILQTGIIDESIATSNKFGIQIQIENEKISIISKY